MSRPILARRARAAFLILAPLLALFALLGPGRAQESDPLEQLRYPKTVVLVRHAEKAADDPRDPSLSAAGLARAEHLARMLGDAGVTHLFSSEFRRTRDTLAPLASLTGARVSTVTARDPKAQISALRSLPRNSVAVVSGHSNTVPGLAKLLAPKSDPTELGEMDYDRMYVVTLTGDEAPATLIELRYGE